MDQYFYVYKENAPIGNKACKYLTRCDMANLRELKLGRIMIIQERQMWEYFIFARENGKNFMEYFWVFI